jgi:glutamine amidotransferase
MCRVLGYLGPSLVLEDLLTKPANSLINQSFDPEQHHLLQLAGTGVAVWERGAPHEGEPLLYKSAHPSFWDRNLQQLCRKVRGDSVLAHIRAASYTGSSSINDDNCHPFLYPGFRLALAHNGGLPGWREMLNDIVGASRPEIVKHLTGSTDTEPLYCLLMSQYADPTADMKADEIVAGLEAFMKRVIEIKRRHDNGRIAKLKLFLADGNDLVVANLGLGPDYAPEIDRTWDELREAEVGTTDFTLAGVSEPVWFLTGDDYADYEGTYEMRVRDPDASTTAIVASEQLTADADDWQRVGLNHAVVIRRSGQHVEVDVRKLQIA